MKNRGKCDVEHPFNKFYVSFFANYQLKFYNPELPTPFYTEPEIQLFEKDENTIVARFKHNHL